MQQPPLHVAQPREYTQRAGLAGFPFEADVSHDDEALEERIAIMVEGGMSEPTARQAALRTQDRERAWRAFLRSAGAILARPEAEHEALLQHYQAEAVRRYGELTGTDMARSMALWIHGRRVH